MLKRMHQAHLYVCYFLWIFKRVGFHLIEFWASMQNSKSHPHANPCKYYKCSLKIMNRDFDGHMRSEIFSVPTLYPKWKCQQGLSKLLIYFLASRTFFRRKIAWTYKTRGRQSYFSTHFVKSFSKRAVRHYAIPK